MQTAKCRQNNMPATILDCLSHSFNFGPNQRTIWHPLVNEPNLCEPFEGRGGFPHPGQVNILWPWESPLGPNYDLIWCSIVVLWNIEWSAVDIKWLHVRVWPHVPWNLWWIIWPPPWWRSYLVLIIISTLSPGVFQWSQNVHTSLDVEGN